MSSAKKILILVFCCWAFVESADAAWVKRNSGTFAWLRSIYFANEKDGWIVGSNGTFLRTNDGGENWKQEKKFTEDTIRDVYFSDSQNGWLLCERNIFGGGGVSPAYLLKTSDGGANWEKVDVAGEGKERIVRIFFSKGGAGLAVGEAGTLWRMENDGKSWKKESLPVRYLMLGGQFADNSRAALVGGSGTILFTDDRGVTWNPAAINSRDFNAKLDSVFFVNQSVGWTVGGQGKILFTNNSGKLWHEQNSTVTENLSDIFFINTAEGWAVGDNGTVVHTTTAGNVWAMEETGIKHKLERVIFVGKKGFAIGFGGTILIYDKNRADDPSKRQPQLQKRNAA